MKAIEKLHRAGWKIFNVDGSPKLGDVVVALDIGCPPTIGVWSAHSDGTCYLDCNGPAGDYFCWGVVEVPKFLSECKDELDEMNE